MLNHETRGRVAVLTLDRPEARNAINPELARALSDAIGRVEADPDVWAAVLAATPPVFSAGADLRTIRDGHVADLHDAHGFAGLTRRQRTKVLVAAVDGPALAGGMELVLACDLVVASEAASFGIPEVKRSLVAAAGGLFRLPRKIPVNVAMECAVTGDPISARRAYEVGMINELCEPGAALDTAMVLAGRVCANPPVAVRESRRVILEQALISDEVASLLSDHAFDRAFGSEDGAEGLAAFLEKRDPVWSGR